MKSRTTKKEEAIERAVETKSLTPQQRIEKLDKQLGVGKGATRERAKLKSMIAQ